MDDCDCFDRPTLNTFPTLTTALPTMSCDEFARLARSRDPSITDAAILHAHTNLCGRRKVDVAAAIDEAKRFDASGSCERPRRGVSVVSRYETRHDADADDTSWHVLRPSLCG
jgi:hypothetical protein